MGAVMDLGAMVLSRSRSVPPRPQKLLGNSWRHFWWQMLLPLVDRGQGCRQTFYNAQDNVLQQSKIPTLPRAEKPWPGERLLAPQKHSMNAMVHKGKLLPQLPSRKLLPEKLSMKQAHQVTWLWNLKLWLGPESPFGHFDPGLLCAEGDQPL